MSEVKTMEQPTVKSITTEELENVKRLQTELQQYCNSIGGMEVQKQKLFIKLICLKMKWMKLKKLLKKSMDLSTLTYLMERTNRL